MAMRAAAAVVCFGLAIGCGSSRGSGTASTPEKDSGGTTGTEDNGAVQGEDTTTPPGDDSTGGGGTTTTIPELQTHPQSSGCDPAMISNVLNDVSIRNAVVTSPRYDAFKPDPESGKEALDGYFIGTPEGGPNSGILLTFPVSLGKTLKQGDQIDVAGEYMEFYCNSQLRASKVDVTGAGTVPAATVVPVDKLVDAATAEQFEGVLVKVENATVESLEQFGTFKLAGGLTVGNRFQTGYKANKGDQLTSITGVIEFSYGAYTLQPRSAGDLEIGAVAPPSEVTIAEIQTDPSSAACPTESSIATTQPSVIVSGTVISPIYKVSAQLSGLYIGTDPSGPNSGVLVVYGPEITATPKPGDTVKIAGEVTEFYCLTEVKAKTLEVTGVGTAPAPAEVAATAIDESYEGSYVTVKDVTVGAIDKFEKYQEFEIDGGVYVLLKDFGVSFTPATGDKLASVTGAVKYISTKDGFKAYLLVPFSAADIVK